MDDFGNLVDDWCAHLRARNRTFGTIRSYRQVADAFAAWMADQPNPPTSVGDIGRRHVEAYIEFLLADRSAATAAKHYRSLQQLFRWLVDEGEIELSPMAKMRPPTVPEKPVPIFSDDDLKKLFATCAANTFENRRDLAIMRLLAESGVRVSELVGMRVDDFDFQNGTVTVLGKGRKMRAAVFNAKTGDALRRYRRERLKHRDADCEAWWLGRQGRMTDSGVRQMIERRGELAGVADAFPHRFRHTMSHNWLAAGGQEQDLMRLNGWSSREMVGRYAASAADERARAASKKAALGDRF